MNCQRYDITSVDSLGREKQMSPCTAGNYNCMWTHWDPQTSLLGRLLKAVPRYSKPFTLCCHLVVIQILELIYGAPILWCFSKFYYTFTDIPNVSTKLSFFHKTEKIIMGSSYIHWFMSFNSIAFNSTCKSDPNLDSALALRFILALPTFCSIALGVLFRSENYSLTFLFNCHANQSSISYSRNSDSSKTM